MSCLIFRKISPTKNFSHFFLSLSYSSVYRSSPPPIWVCHPLSFSHLVRQQRQWWCWCCWYYWHQLILSNIFYDILLHESASLPRNNSVRLYSVCGWRNTRIDCGQVGFLRLLEAIIGHNPKCMSEPPPRLSSDSILLVGKSIFHFWNKKNRMNSFYGLFWFSFLIEFSQWNGQMSLTVLGFLFLFIYFCEFWDESQCIVDVLSFLLI